MISHMELCDLPLKLNNNEKLDFIEAFTVR